MKVTLCVFCVHFFTESHFPSTALGAEDVELDRSDPSLCTFSSGEGKTRSDPLMTKQFQVNIGGKQELLPIRDQMGKDKLRID